MIPGTFCRVTRGRFHGMTGVVMSVDGGWATLVMTSTGARRRFQMGALVAEDRSAITVATTMAMREERKAAA